MSHVEAYDESWCRVVLSAEQMVAALYGDQATPEQATAAKKMYAQLDDATKAKVNAAGRVTRASASGGRRWTAARCASPPVTATRTIPPVLTAPTIRAPVRQESCPPPPGRTSTRSAWPCWGATPLGESTPSLQGSWASTAGPPIVTLEVNADDSFSLTMSVPDSDFERVYSGTIEVTATAISATITARHHERDRDVEPSSTPDPVHSMMRADAVIGDPLPAAPR